MNHNIDSLDEKNKEEFSLDGEEYDYKEDLKIDKYNLDEECVTQPQRFNKWAALHIEMIAMRDRSKQKLTLTRANADSHVRQLINQGRGKELNVTKGTEAEIKTAVDLNPEVIEAEENLIEANRKVGVFTVAREAFHDRKKELENLVQLWLSSYWADPRLAVYKNNREDKNEEEHRAVVAETMKRRASK